MRSALMFIRIEKSPDEGSRQRFIVIECDECGQERKTTFCLGKQIKAQTKLSFCSRACQNTSQKTGALRKQIDAVFQQRFGCSTPLNLSSSRNNLRIALCNGGLAKTRSTLQERYGVDNPMRIKEIATKQHQAIRDARNGLHHFETEDGLNARRQTCMRKYGFEHHLQNPDIVAAFPYKEVWRKSHQTKKLNGTYKSSRSERMFEAWLRLNFGKRNIRRGVIVNDWSIDFEITLGDDQIFIQYDGVYWHGLDATSREELEIREGVRAQRILAVFDRDKEQIAWFKQANKSFYRVTDKDFEKFIWQKLKRRPWRKKSKGSAMGSFKI